MKIAVLGGSFNPVHKGHLLLADSVCTQLGYDKLLFIPVSAPPHKIIKNAASSFDRLKMLQLACEDDFRFAVDSCEIDRGGISYTWDTVCFLEHKYAEQLSAKIGLIVGQDLAAEFSKWKNAAKEFEPYFKLVITIDEDKNHVEDGWADFNIYLVCNWLDKDGILKPGLPELK